MWYYVTKNDIQTVSTIISKHLNNITCYIFTLKSYLFVYRYNIFKNYFIKIKCFFVFFLERVFTLNNPYFEIDIRNTGNTIAQYTIQTNNITINTMLTFCMVILNVLNILCALYFPSQT